MKNITAKQITNQLSGKWHGHEGRAKCPAHGGHNLNLAIRDYNGRVYFQCYSHGCDWRDIWKAIGMVYNDILLSKDPNTTRTTKESPDTNNLISKLWNNSHSAASTLVSKYLAARGYRDPIPATIRYLPNCWHKPSQGKYPCMIAAVTVWPDKKLSGLHRTYLKHDGTGKAEIHSNKMMLGKISGGAVRFNPCTESIVLAEGIETALSILMACESKLTVWATLSANGLKSVKLPDLPLAANVTIAVDYDKTGLLAAEYAAEKLTNESRRIKICVPPNNGQDFNDVLMGA